MKKFRTVMMALAKNKKIPTKLLSLFLTVLLVFYAIPTVIYGEIADAVNGIGSGDGTSSETASAGEETSVYDYVGAAYEDESLREESAKHFHLEDGSYVAAQYNYPVHYLDSDGRYKDIDNALSEASGGVYANENARIKFAKKLTGNETLFTLHDGNTKITFSLVGANKGTVGNVTNATDAPEATELQKMMNLENLSSSIIYENVLDGVDIEYVVHSLNVKENIIVKEKSDSYSYSFEIKLNGLSAALSDSGDIIITDSKSGAVTYNIPAPIVFDANGTYAPSGVAAYTLAGSGNKYTLTVSVSNEWMNSSERAFPVTVDPTLGYASSAFSDTYIDYNNPDTNYNSSETFYVDLDCTAFWITSSLTNLPRDSYILSASLAVGIMAHPSSKTADRIAASKVISSWNANTLTYNTHLSGTGELDEDILDVCVISHTDVNTYCTFNVTKAVREWYSGEAPNYGIALLSLSGNGTTFYSEETSNDPLFTVNYRDMKGVESYWSTSSHSAGYSGVGDVNLATGQLTFAIPTLSTTAAILQYTPTLVYNSSLAGKDFVNAYTQSSYVDSYAPYGFKLNTCETVIQKGWTDLTGASSTVMIWVDPDGTEHAFHPTADNANVYADEDGLQKTITLNEDGTLTLTDDSYNKRVFSQGFDSPSVSINECWHLSSIVDPSGNAMSFGFDNYYRPTSIIFTPKLLSSVTMLELSYYSNGRLKMIYDPVSLDAVIFRYSETYAGELTASAPAYLRRIDFAHGTSDVSLADWESFVLSAANITNITIDATSNYTYNESGYLVSVSDAISDQRIDYTWTNNKLTGISHYADESLGQSVSIAYENGYTAVRSTGNDELLNTDDDVITRYVFDANGRANNVYSISPDYSEIYGATIGEYATQENVKNTLEKQTVFGGSSVNYLLNGGFEASTGSALFDNWEHGGNVTRVSSRDFDGNYAARFSPTAGTSAYLKNYVKLSAGTYTLSMVYAPFGCDSTEGVVTISSISQTGFLHTEKISLDPNEAISLGESFRFFATTFELPAIDSLSITITFTTASDTVNTPSVKLDQVMLDKAKGASDYSLVKYGGFEASGITSSRNKIDLSEYWNPPYGTEPTIVQDGAPFSNVVMISGAINNPRTVYQRIYEADEELLSKYGTSSFTSNANHSYMVSGFGKSENAILSSYGKFRLRADVTYYRGTDNSEVTVSYYFNFLPDFTDWQFTGGSFSTDYDAPDGDNGDYSCVKYIDVACEYSYQQPGYALFDNISVIEAPDTAVTSYEFYENGLLKSAGSKSYTEYYVYNSSRDLIRVANSHGIITDYRYTEEHRVSTEILSTCSYLKNYPYPWDADDPYEFLNELWRYETGYIYNTYGFCSVVLSYALNPDGSKDQAAGKVYNHYIYDCTDGSRTFGVLLQETDSIDNKVKYFYDSSDGKLLSSINVTLGEGLCYTYDASDRLIGVFPATYSAQSNTYTATSDAENVTYTYNSNNLLSTIETDSTTYTFSYDVFGNATGISAGDNSLATYEYNDNNGKLKKITYANGKVVEYIYNTLELITEIWYTDNGERAKAYEYEYTADGQLYKYTDVENGKSTVYKYDSHGKLLTSAEYSIDDMHEDHTVEFAYNSDNRIDYVVNSLSQPVNDASNSTSWVYQYAYRDDGYVSHSTIVTEYLTVMQTYNHDRQYRKLDDYVSYVDQENCVSMLDGYVAYTYKTVDGYTTGLVETYTSQINGSSLTYTYTYDSNGNITKVSYSNGKETRYVYDDIGQLIREDNQIQNFTYVYAYDNAGNITSITRCGYLEADEEPPSYANKFEFAYSSSEWGDVLTSFRGTANTYDEIGNPLTYYNGSSYIFTWDGRQLASATYGYNFNYSYTYKYNDEGLRISKTSNTGVTTTYYYNGTQLVAEERAGSFTIYFYDTSGSPIGFQYQYTDPSGNFVCENYHYGKNLQGDIVAVYDMSGNALIEYTYSAYGRCSYSLNDNASSTSAINNPFRYRGYYYDEGLGLYYLGSRYYDPITGRFISPDHADVVTVSPLSLTDKNLYAYCDNNPVMRVDHSGALWDTVFDVVSLGLSVVDVINNPDDVWAWVGLALDAVDLIPFVSGLGEASDMVRIASKADDIIDAADDVHDTVKIAKAVDFTEDAADKIKALDRSSGFTKSTASMGRQIHNGYKATKEFKLNYKEFRDIKGIRPDYVDFDNKIIYELKPMNPRSIKSGIRQLQRYNKALGGGFTMILEVY